MNKDELLDNLQKFDAGVFQEIPPVWADMIKLLHPVARRDGHYQWYENGKGIENGSCPICGADVVIYHHVCLYSERRFFSGDKPKSFKRYIGIIRICPNCHYKVHSGLNPYFTGNRGLAVEQVNTCVHGDNK